MALPQTPINTIPAGLTDFFGIRSSGANPQALTDQLVNTLDLLQWYAGESQYAQYVSVGDGSTNTGIHVILDSEYLAGNRLPIDAAGGVEIPQNEVWVVNSFNIDLTFDATAPGDPVHAIPAFGKGTPFPNVRLWTRPFFSSGAIQFTAAGRKRMVACTEAPFVVNGSLPLRPIWFLTTNSGVVADTFSAVISIDVTRCRR